VRVVLLEAGPGDGPAVMSSPNPAAALSLRGSAVDWAYVTTAQPGTGGAVHRWPRGRVLGGSRSINAMMHVRGHRSGYDAWAADGATGWDYDKLLPFFRRSEHTSGLDPAVRGTSGPMIIEAGPPPGAVPPARTRTWSCASPRRPAAALVRRAPGRVLHLLRAGPPGQPRITPAAQRRPGHGAAHRPGLPRRRARP
jgi:choline dehydrogenase-like flavoprotein